MSLINLKSWGRGRWAIAIGSVAYALVFVFMLVARPGSKDFYHLFFNLYEMLPPIFAGTCGIVLAFRGTHVRKSAKIGWFLVGLGCLSFAMGQGLWTFFESFLGQEVPFPGWPDAGYVGSYPCLLVGMLLLFNSSQAVGRARLLLDGAIAASALGVLSWYFIIGHLWAQTDVSLLGKCISVAYPLGDLATLFMALVIFNSLGQDRSGRKSMALLGVGIVMLTFADTVFTVMGFSDSYETGNWNDWGWSFGWLLIAFACLNRLWNPKQAIAEVATQAKNRGWVFALRAFGPYVAIAASLLITFGSDYFKHGRINLSAHQEVFLLVALIVVRQVFMLLENVGLNRRISAINDDLEHRVVERTRQITCLQALTRAVNTTLSVEEVLSEGSRHLSQLLEADAVAIWLTGTKGDAPHFVEGFDPADERLTGLAARVRFAGDTPCSISDASHANYLVAPLNWHGERVGSLVLARWTSSFDQTEVDLLDGVALELASALHNAIQHAEAIRAADHDAVTGLYNHRAFHQRFARSFEAAEKSERPLSVMMLDLNNFKLFNDTYGHMAGDEVLKTVARTLTAACPAGSMVGRYGGDEFVISLPTHNGDQAEGIAKILAEKLVDVGYTRVGEERKIPITVSVGIATFPTDATSRHDLIAIADQNLYSAKASEDGVVRLSSQQLENRALRTEGSFEVLDALVTAVDNKDRYTRKHSEDVTEYALWIAEELGLSEETMRIIRIAGLLHDVGKIGVPSEVLRKPGRLSPEEFELIKRHPRLGELIVSAIPGMEPIVDGVKSHHERWDGHGYPDQLAAENIPFLGRLLAVADAFSAMTTDRPYRKGMDWDIAISQIESNRGSQFDPDLADAFLRAAARRKSAVLSNISTEAA